METIIATNESTRDAQPLTSFGKFWRLVTSIFVRYQSPVFSFHPDQCHAKSSSDIARNCADVWVGFEDKVNLRYLKAVRRRWEKSGWNNVTSEKRKDLTAVGLMLGVDIGVLLEYAELNIASHNV